MNILQSTTAAISYDVQHHRTPPTKWSHLQWGSHFQSTCHTKICRHRPSCPKMSSVQALDPFQLTAFVICFYSFKQNYKYNTIHVWHTVLTHVCKTHQSRHVSMQLLQCLHLSQAELQELQLIHQYMNETAALQQKQPACFQSQTAQVATNVLCIKSKCIMTHA